MTAYAELAVTTNFSFLRGASHPQEMVAAADELGLAAIGIADRNSFAGVVRAYVAGVHRYRGDEPRRFGLLDALGARTGAPLVAVNDVHHHVAGRRVLADVVTCIREKCTIAEAGFRLAANAERHLKSPAEMARLFADFPDAIKRTVAIASACRFSLGELRNEYPDEPVPPGWTAQEHLEDL